MRNRLNRSIPMHGRYRHRRGGAVAALAAVSLLAAACGSNATTGGSTSTSTSSPGGTSGSGGKGTLVIAGFAPYSGADASYGPEEIAGAIAAMVDINKNGGVLGHKFSWVNVDDRGDPADAVPAAYKMIASTANLVGVMGPDSNEATATIPILNKAHLPMNIGAGQSLFDKTSYAYLYRNTPPDAADGYAMAVYARNVRHYKTAVAIYATDVASAGAGPASVQGFQALGGKIVLNLTLSPGQPSYETQAQQVVSAHPDVIFTEEDAPTGATFFKELYQLGGLVPIIGTSGTIVPGWLSAMSSALSPSVFAKHYLGMTFGPLNPTQTPGVRNYLRDVRAATGDVESPDSQWLTDPYAMSTWDFTNEIALAMLEANSVSTQVFNPFIVKVTEKTPGAVVVHSFAEGAAALKKGEHIVYVGALGPSTYNQWHNAFGNFNVQVPNGAVVGNVSSDAISPLVAKFG